MHHGLQGACQGVDAHPRAAVFPVLRDVFRHTSRHAEGVHPGELGAVGARDLVCGHEHRSNAVAGAGRVGGAVVIHAVVGGHLIALGLGTGVGGGDQQVKRVGIRNVRHDGPTARVEAFVDDVPKRFRGGLEVPVDVGQSVVDVHMADHRGLAASHANDEVGSVAFVNVEAIGGQLSDPVNEHLCARTGIVGVRSAKRVVGDGGHKFPGLGQLAEAFNLEVATCGISGQSVGAVPGQIHGAWRGALVNVDVNGAQKRRRVGHRLQSIFDGDLHADVAVRQLVGVVQERRHHPSCRQDEVAHDDFGRDDVPLGAQRVLVQVKHLDLILHKFLGAHRGEDVPMERGIARVVHIVHVGQVGRNLGLRHERPQHGQGRQGHGRASKQGGQDRVHGQKRAQEFAEFHTRKSFLNAFFNLFRKSGSL